MYSMKAARKTSYEKWMSWWPELQNAVVKQNPKPVNKHFNIIIAQWVD